MLRRREEKDGRLEEPQVAQDGAECVRKGMSLKACVRKLICILKAVGRVWKV